MTQYKEYRIFVDELKRKFNSKSKKIVLLCIGSCNIVGDCFGPMVGSNLKYLHFKKKVDIIGDMKSPVCASNAEELIKKLDKKNYIIAIDSALSECETEGIYISSNKMILGSGINKKIAKVGDISIKCCVGVKSNCNEKNIQELYRTNKRKIIVLSKIVSNGLYEIINSNEL